MEGKTEMVVLTCWAGRTWQLDIGRIVTLVIVPLLQGMKVATTTKTAASTIKAASDAQLAA